MKCFADSQTFSLSDVRNTAIINFELRKIRKINDRIKRAIFRKIQNMGKKNSNKLLTKTTESGEILNTFLIINFTVI